MRKLSFTIVISSLFAMVACGGGGGGDGSGPEAAQNMAVALRGSGQIAIIDLSDYSIAATYNIGIGLQSIDISPDQQFFYVTDNPGGQGATSPDLLWVVNVGTGAIADSIALGGAPWGVKVHPDGTKAYVTLNKDQLLVVVDLTLNSVASTIALPGESTGLDISPDGSVVCIPNMWDDTISFFNTSAETLTTIGPVPGSGNASWEVAISPDGNYCWIGDGEGGGTVSVYSTSTYALMASIQLSVADTSGGQDQSPNPIVFSPDGNRVYVAGKYTSEVMVLDAVNYNQLSTIPTSTTDTENPKRLAADFDGSRLFLSSDGDDFISVIDLTTDTEVEVINFNSGDRPNGLVLY